MDRSLIEHRSAITALACSDLIWPSSKPLRSQGTCFQERMVISSSQAPAQTYRRQQRILSAPIDDQIVMMSVERGQYYNLNAVGTRIWHLLETPRSLAQIVTALAEIYDAPDKKIRAEAGAFLARLEREGLLEIVTVGDP
jgi:hypothetical protein